MIRRLIAAALLLVCAWPALATCLVAGDSIALGTAQQLGGCARDAKVGIPSAAIVARVRPGFDFVVVSAGSNDPLNPRLTDNLDAARARASARVIWIVPQHRIAAGTVREVAARNGDALVLFVSGRDGIHPRAYPALARDVLALMLVRPVPLPPVRP